MRNLLSWLSLGLITSIILQSCAPSSDLKGGGGVARARQKDNKSFGSSDGSTKDGTEIAPRSSDGSIGNSGSNDPSLPIGSGGVPNQFPSPNPVSPTSPSNAPEGIRNIGSVAVAAPDLTTCAKAPSKGKRRDGTCNSNEVLVIVNDGDAPEMTCCPVGNNVLSSVSAEKHILRDVCGSNEVATGVKRPKLYCTKINTTYLKLSDPIKVKYTTSSSGLTQEEKLIASVYNENDACICKNGSVVIGPHTNSNDQCAESCVQILKK